jgi:hypothetical protein
VQVVARRAAIDQFRDATIEQPHRDQMVEARHDPWLVGSLNETFEQYPAIGALLPAMGYSPEQIRDMENTINATECDVVVIATPIDLRRLMNIKHPSVMVGYELQEIGRPTLHDVISDKLAKLERARATRPAAKKKKAAARPTRSAAKKKKAATAARRSR